MSVKWLILAIFFVGMISSLKWHEAVTNELRTTYGVLALAAFALVLVLGNIML